MRGGNDMKTVELMAPAGSKESFLGAINAGCNAVYLAGKKFGARAFANNFDTDEMGDLIRYAHVRDVCVYVTINTLIFNEEVETVLLYVEQLAKWDVDAVIVQDLGMIDLIHRRFPKLVIHASTQVNAHNVDQVRFLKELGVSRVILARETSIDVIKQIKKQIDIEVEVFVHGALCVCYSGNCLFSSMVGKRSGNRGECGQPCRLPYTLLKDGTPVSDEAYLMSTKDLMTIEHLDELIRAGVDALKIEGRMRKPEYVVQSVLSYRKAITAFYDKKRMDFDEEIDRLKRVFNREYTDGYVLNAQPYTLNNPYRPNHMGIEVGSVMSFVRGKATIRLTGDLSVNDGYRIVGTTDTGDVVSRIVKDGELIPTAGTGDIIVLDLKDSVEPGSTLLKTLDHGLVKSLETYLDPDYKLIPIRGFAHSYVGKPLSMEVTDEAGHQALIESEFVVPAAKNAPMTKSAIEEQLSKLGNTSFYWIELNVETDELGFIPVKILNELRRLAIEKMTALRGVPKHTVEMVPEIVSPGNFVKEPFEMIAKIRTLDQLDVCIQRGIKTIYYEDAMELDPTRYPNISFFKVKRRIWPDSAIFTINENSVISEVGGLLKSQDYVLVADNFMNVTNIETAHLLSRKGVKSVTLSLELHQEHIRDFSSLYAKKFGVLPNLEMIVYGRTELMISKYCPIAKTMGANKTHCHLCEHNQYALKDRMDYEFALVNDGDCNIRLLNPKPLCLIDSLAFFKEANISKIRLDFTIENREETLQIIEAFQHALKKEPFLINRHTMTYGRFLN